VFVAILRDLGRFGWFLPDWRDDELGGCEFWRDELERTCGVLDEFWGTAEENGGCVPRRGDRRSETGDLGLTSGVEVC